MFFKNFSDQSPNLTDSTIERTPALYSYLIVYRIMETKFKRTIRECKKINIYSSRSINSIKLFRKKYPKSFGNFS